MISVGETYKGYQRVSYKEARSRFNKGENIKMLPCYVNIDCSQFKDSPWWNKYGDVLVRVSNGMFKKILQNAEIDFDSCVESYEDEWCDEYFGSRAAFLIETIGLN